MAEFVGGLRRLSEHCRFGTTLEDILRDRLVCGINDDRAQRLLLAERELSFEKAVEIALAHEMASKNLIDLSGKATGSVNKVKESTKPRGEDKKRECHRCGGNHDPAKSVFKNETYYKCQQKGHMANVCTNKKKPRRQERSGRRQTVQSDGKRNPTEYKQQTHFVQDNEEDVHTMYHLSSQQKKPFKVEIVLGGLKTMMEIDTGASKKILSETTYKRLRDTLGPFRETKAVLSTYTGERIPTVGKALILVKYENQQQNLKAIIR